MNQRHGPQPQASHPHVESDALAGTRPGRFAYDTATETWDWDDRMVQIMGLEPWSGTPSTAHLLERVHPDDRSRVSAVLLGADSTGGPWHLTCRLVAADGAERRVLLVWETRRRPEDESVTGISGHGIDLTDDFRDHSAEVARQAVTASAEHRSTIERAVGVLMVAYGLDADQGFEMLRWWSQNRNIKVRTLAARLLEEARRGAASEPAVHRTFDALLHDASTRRAEDTSGA